MVSMTFDTHRVVKDLQEAGFDEAQAEAVVNALGNAIDRDVVKSEDLKDFATKDDTVGVREEMTELRQDMSDLRQDMVDLRQDMVRLREDMVDFRGEMRTEMKALELRLTVRLTGVMLATAGLTVAILKLFP